ncbi:hypothetical protein LCGC14_1098370 [marine sediment metagenome]|uniref:Uncharacterized protein n=1 Tax=marine sediment metagenome TaxID=412755 RepID=A0A0F9QGE1_9ZZZZ
MMAIRLNPERLLGLVMFVLFLLWAFLAATGCATVEDVVIPVTAADLSNETTTTTTVPVSAGDVQGDLTVITLAGATPWTIAALVGVLLAFQARRHNTTTGALDRVIREINAAAPTEARNQIKVGVASYYECGPHGEVLIDRHERLIRCRLEKQENMTDDHYAQDTRKTGRPTGNLDPTTADEWMAKVRAWAASHPQFERVPPCCHVCGLDLPICRECGQTTPCSRSTGPYHEPIFQYERHAT